MATRTELLRARFANGPPLDAQARAARRERVAHHLDLITPARHVGHEARCGVASFALHRQRGGTGTTGSNGTWMKMPEVSDVHRHPQTRTAVPFHVAMQEHTRTSRGPVWPRIH